MDYPAYFYQYKTFPNKGPRQHSRKHDAEITQLSGAVALLIITV